jgi:dienelactone hydrolase
MVLESFKVKTFELEYYDSGARLLAFVAEPIDCKPNTPVILIAHMWSGRVKFVEEKAKYFASLGYIGMAVDVYGDAKTGQTPEQNSALMQPFIQDRQLMQSRMNAAFKAAQQLETSNSKQIIALGYCFGGLCVQDLARINSDVKGIVSIHGLMSPASNINQGMFKSKVLLLHGSDDPMVTDNDWYHLRRELNTAQCDWQKHDFGGVMHAFTNPLANDQNSGTVFNKSANLRSEKLVIDFIKECFQNE